MEDRNTRNIGAAAITWKEVPAVQVSSGLVFVHIALHASWYPCFILSSYGGGGGELYPCLALVSFPICAATQNSEKFESTRIARPNRYEYTWSDVEMLSACVNRSLDFFGILTRGYLYVDIVSAGGCFDKSGKNRAMTSLLINWLI